MGKLRTFFVSVKDALSRHKLLAAAILLLAVLFYFQPYLVTCHQPHGTYITCYLGGPPPAFRLLARPKRRRAACRWSVVIVTGTMIVVAALTTAATARGRGRGRGRGQGQVLVQIKPGSLRLLALPRHLRFRCAAKCA